MAQTKQGEELKSVFPLLASLWALSTLTGVVLTFSTFFGATLGALVAAVVGHCVHKMWKAERITAKAPEVILLSSFIPILGAASACSTAHYPLAITAINTLLVSTALPHLMVILGTSEKLNHIHLLSFAALLLITNPAALFLTEEPTLSTILPFSTITIYALSVLCRAIFLLREKVSIRALKWSSLALTLACVTASVYFNFYAFPRFVGSLIETIACYLLFSYLDFLQYQMRTPHAKWTSATLEASLTHCSVKFLAVLSAVMWAGIAPFMESASEAHNRAFPESSESAKPIFVMFWGMFQWFIIVLFVLAQQEDRRKEPYVAVSDKRRAVVLSCIVAVLAINIAFAFYYILAALPRNIPSIILFLSIGILYILLTYFLDEVEAFLAPFNAKFAWLCSGLATYAFISLLYLDATAPQNSTSLAGGNHTTGTIINDEEEISIQNKTNTLVRMFSQEGTVEQEGTFEWYRYPIVRVCWVIGFLFTLLATHFALVFSAEDENKKRRVSARPATKSTTRPKSRPPLQQIPPYRPPRVERDSDSDYHSVDNEGAERQAMI